MFRFLALSAAAAILSFASLQTAEAQNAKAQPRLPAQVGIDNQRAAILSELVIADSEGKVIGKLAQPVAAGKKGVVKLAKATGCEMSIQAKFDDEGEVDETVNLCRDKVLRFKE